MNELFVTFEGRSFITANDGKVPDGWSGYVLLPGASQSRIKKRSLKSFEACVTGSNITSKVGVFEISSGMQALSRFAFVDAEAWYAFANRNNPKHSEISSILLRSKAVLVTSDSQLGRLESLLRSDDCLDERAIDFIWELWQSKCALTIRTSDMEKTIAWGLYISPASKHDVDFATCADFVVIKRYGINLLIGYNKTYNAFRTFFRAYL